MGAATTLVVLATWGCWGKTSRDEASDAGEGPVAGAGGALVAAAGGAAGRAGGDAGGGPVSFDEGNYDFCQHWAFERASETCSVALPELPYDVNRMVVAVNCEWFSEADRRTRAGGVGGWGGAEPDPELY